jgi:hypothetical protein
LASQAEFDQVLQYAKYILEHLAEMLLDLCNPLRKAAFFGAIFNTVPTYAQINLRTKEKSPLPEVNELFLIHTNLKSQYGDLKETKPRGLATAPQARCKHLCLWFVFEL